MTCLFWAGRFAARHADFSAEAEHARAVARLRESGSSYRVSDKYDGSADRAGAAVDGATFTPTANASRGRPDSFART